MKKYKKEKHLVNLPAVKKAGGNSETCTQEPFSWLKNGELPCLSSVPENLFKNNANITNFNLSDAFKNIQMI